MLTGLLDLADAAFLLLFILVLLPALFILDNDEEDLLFTDVERLEEALLLAADAFLAADRFDVAFLAATLGADLLAAADLDAETVLAIVFLAEPDLDAEADLAGVFLAEAVLDADADLAEAFRAEAVLDADLAEVFRAEPDFDADADLAGVFLAEAVLDADADLAEVFRAEPDFDADADADLAEVFPTELDFAVEDLDEADLVEEAFLAAAFLGSDLPLSWLAA